MNERVYLETTLVSYLTARPSRDLIVAAHQHITRDWWDTRRVDYVLCVSQLVIQEAGDGDPRAAQERLDVLATMTMLEITEEAVALAEELGSGGGLADQSRERRVAHRGGGDPSGPVPCDVELPAYGQCDHASAD